jgi:beta-N-acetylhexosaminidase
VGQLFVAPACPLFNDDHLRDLSKLINECHVGSVILKQSDGAGPGQFLNRLQSLSPTPLLVMTDAEWGLSMMMRGAPNFPKNMTLGAIQDLSLIERLGAEIGHQARLVGIHMNLAPVVDVNTDPKNPIIHMRSFGDNPDSVAKRGHALSKGMQKAGLMTCLKHFPGHGNTSVDSHHALPVIDQSVEALSKVELVPFIECFDADAVMIGHIVVPQLDQVPATLSFSITTELLKKDLGFKGLVITDALNMKALTNSYSTDEIALQAHGAGSDLLLYGSHLVDDVRSLIREEIPFAYYALVSAYKAGQFHEKDLDAIVLRILQAKEHFGDCLAEENPDLHTQQALDLKEELYLAAITQFGPSFTPIDPDTAYLEVNVSGGALGVDALHPAFCPCMCYTLDEKGDVLTFPRVVVSLRNLDPKKVDCGMTKDALTFFKELSSKVDVIYCVFGTPYAVKLLPQQSTILLGYEEDAQKAVLRILTEELKPTGVSPVH